MTTSALTGADGLIRINGGEGLGARLMIGYQPGAIGLLGDPRHFGAMQAYFIAHDLPADLVQDHGNVLDFEMGPAGSVIFVRLQIDAHALLQVRQRGVRFDIADFLASAEEEAIAVLHGYNSLSSGTASSGFAGAPRLGCFTP